MTLAIMQPYFMPYIGYFQLLQAVDRFVVYDDVAFINRGWVNRNQILVGGKAHLFTIPLREASQNKKIREIQLDESTKWREKLLRTVEQSYKRAPQFEPVHSILSQVLGTPAVTIADLARNGLSAVNTYLGIQTEVIPSSAIYDNEHLKAQERILECCQKAGATRYINPIGGRELYDKARFAEAGIELFFIQSKRQEYPQKSPEFVPWLSILDVLMWSDVAQTHALLSGYELV
ncbi:MAG: WbqC family protein [Sphingobacteriaceae bacterium]|nr:WbqC family protein [Cytophagaceae bacterium]